MPDGNLHDANDNSPKAPRPPDGTLAVDRSVLQPTTPALDIGRVSPAAFERHAQMTQEA